MAYLKHDDYADDDDDGYQSYDDDLSDELNDSH